jgi:hypothetical protein
MPIVSSCFARPFAPAAIGFRAMTKVPLNSDRFGGAQVAAYIGGHDRAGPSRFLYEAGLLSRPARPAVEGTD